MIRILEDYIANKIAAGEVITSPLAVVKELLENAIDAGATAITCEIRKGGKEYIRLTDNGCGIPSDEVELAFEKHATGKIATEEDLSRIGTLGFRGEALGSIATVSVVELVTRTADEAVGTRLLLTHGEVTERKGIGCEVGTTVVVRDLFENLPARLKFMQSDRAEGAKIHDFLGKMAIAYPEIAIRFISQGNVIFHTKGKGDGLAAVMTVYGGGLKGKLIPVERESADGTLALRAYIADPTENRPSKRSQIFFVNGRLVGDKVIDRAISRAYKNRLFAGRYPVVYLFLDVAPNLLDVNIHPSKDEVRFYDPERIEDFIEEALSDALADKELVPQTKPRKMPAPTADDTYELPVSRDAGAATVRDGAAAKPSQGTQVDVAEVLKQLRSRDTEETKENDREEAIPTKETITPSSKPFDFSALTPHGVIFATYILASDEDSFYLLDQHACHERVRFERIMKTLRAQSGESQMLLTPLTVELGPEGEALQPVLEQLGFEIEPFGPTTWLVRAVPLSFKDVDLDSFFKDFADDAAAVDLVGEELYTRIATMACKGAVKAHDRLRDEEIQGLLLDLAACDNPFSCPHGRPTFLRMKLSDIERDFKRK